MSDASFVPSWLGAQEALALARACQRLPENPQIVEIGSFLGKSAIVMAGACKIRGSGTVHCVDPFDASGDAFSVPVYRSIASADRRSLRERFDANIARARVVDCIRVHQGTAESIAASWDSPIDLLFIDGDQSPAGARRAYDAWHGFLKIGGVIALHNSTDRVYAAGHDGIHLLAVHMVQPPKYTDIYAVETTTFGRKIA